MDNRGLVRESWKVIDYLGAGVGLNAGDIL
jgi:hypothetical protein